MPVRRFLVTLAVAGLASISAWVIVVKYIDPEQSGLVGLSLFYATLFCSVFVVVVLLGILGRVLLRRLRGETVLAFKLMLPTLRQALWCSCIVVISLILASQQLFSWFAAVVLVLFFTLLEGFLYSLQTSSTPHEAEPTVG